MDPLRHVGMRRTSSAQWHGSADLVQIAAQIPNAAQSSFTAIILKTFGFGTLQTQYMRKLSMFLRFDGDTLLI